MLVYRKAEGDGFSLSRRLRLGGKRKVGIGDHGATRPPIRRNCKVCGKSYQS